MISKEEFQEWVKIKVKEYELITPSALALSSYYVLDIKGWKFVELRAIAEQTKQVYLTTKKRK